MSVSVLFHTLEHTAMLHFISSYGPIKVRSKFDSAFTGIIHRGKPVHKLFKCEIVVVALPILDRFCEEGRFKLTELKKCIVYRLNQLFYNIAFSSIALPSCDQTSFSG